MDATDKSYLILFARVEEGETTQVVSTVIPWTELAHIAFRVEQRGESHPQAKPA